ncbi:TPA: hypothetical protein ACKP22_001093 [Pseudomonas putida]
MKTHPLIRFKNSLPKIHAWANDNFPPEVDLVTSYINGGGCLYEACGEFFNIGMREMGAALTQATSKITYSSQQKFSSSISKLMISDIILVSRLKGTHHKEPAALDDFSHKMLCLLACGQYPLIEPCYTELIIGLRDGYGIQDGHDLPIGTTLRYAAFGLTIIGDWLGKPLDLDKHALPRDPAWGQLVAHWREPDPEKLLPILLDACDTHVERIALNSREVDSGNFEFGSPFEAVYPAEILAIKNLRLSLGLKTPFIDHPLMKSPYAMLTLPPNTPLEHDELLEQFLKAACRYNPEAVPEGLYEAVRETGAIR